VRSDASAVAHGGKVYIIGGFTGSEVLRSVEIYDPTKDEWRFGPTLNIARSGLKVWTVSLWRFLLDASLCLAALSLSLFSLLSQAVILDNKIYAIGGFDGEERLASVEILDLLEPFSTWTIASSSLCIGRSNFGACVVDKAILYSSPSCLLASPCS